jgi:predicted PurR-regulated permease PerM
MSLKKFLKRGVKVSPIDHSGQVMVEYFILFCLLTALVLITGSSLFNKAANLDSTLPRSNWSATLNFMETSFNAMEQKNIGTLE